MVQQTALASKRRLNGVARESRRARIFARLREGWAYTEIAREEGLTGRRVRQIVSKALEKRIVDPAADHARLQLMRLEPALKLAAGALAGGALEAIQPYLKLIERLDRYQPAAAAPQVYDEAARQRLYAKMTRIAAQLKAREAKTAQARAAPEGEAEPGGET